MSKITNEQKYTTAEERVKAFGEFCKNEFCNQCNHLDCKLHKQGSAILNCYDGWLSLEADEEKPEPCPFCGGECLTSNAVGGMWRVYCEKDMTCLYSSGTFVTEAEAIAAHNRVARAVRAAKEVAMAPTQVRYERMPRRNCDRFANADDAWDSWTKTHDPDKMETPFGKFQDWLFAPVADGGEK